MRKRYLAWLRSGTLLWLCLAWAHASAQVLDTIEVSREGDFAVIEANFSRPVFYVRHFPPTAGETLQIYLRVPVVLSEPGQREIPVRKSIKAPPVDNLPLQDVTYEGTGVEGPRLIVRFTRPVQYSIEKGRSDRSIKIFVRMGAPPPGPQPSGRAAPPPSRPSAATDIPRISFKRPPSAKEPPATGKNLVVTLVPSLTTPADMVDVKRKLIKLFPNATIYQMQAVVFGKTIDLVRLGFFLTARKLQQRKKSSRPFTL